jgi:hypothetical protein
MNLRRSLRTFLLVGSFISGTFLVAQQPASQDASPADNTKVNQRDQNANEPTADQQKTICPIATSLSRFAERL